MPLKQTYLSWQDSINLCHIILRQLQQDQWFPDYVVGLTRGGLFAGNLISQYLDVPLETLKVSLRSHESCESNLWMAEDAHQGKKILIVDDINDSGATINWIRKDWQGSQVSDDPQWAAIWGDTVRIAVMVDNQSSDCELPISYSGLEVNKLEDPQWIVFPWEDWWQR